jgi:hypothetical protein
VTGPLPRRSPRPSGCDRCVPTARKRSPPSLPRSR